MRSKKKVRGAREKSPLLKENPHARSSDGLRGKCQSQTLGVLGSCPFQHLGGDFDDIIPAGHLSRNRPASLKDMNGRGF